MRRFLLLLLCVLTVPLTPNFAQEVTHAPVADNQNVPTDFGVYLKNGDNWDKMYAADRTGEKLDCLMFGCDVIVRYQRPTAPLTTDSTLPGIFVIGDNQTAPRDIFIVRLRKLKDHRELKAGTESSNGKNFKQGYAKQDTFEVEVRDSGHKRLIVPKKELTPGEYILILDEPTEAIGYGYDFTVPGKVTVEAQ